MADGKRPTLDVEDRTERGTRAAKRLRREGYVPGVVYGGKDGDCTSFKVNWRDLRQVLAGSALIDLKVGGKTRPVIVKDQQQHPVRDELLHIDLLEVRLDEKIQTQVSVHLEGAEEAPGIKEGGVLEHVTHQLNIEALPTDIPEAIVVDVSGLEIAATMHLSEISPPQGVTFLDDPEETILATVVVPTEVEEPEIEEETELVGEDGEPLEEGAEPPRARRAPSRPRARPLPPRRPRAPSEPLPPPRRRKGGLAGGRARESGRPLRPDAPQRGLRGREAARRAAGAAEVQAEVRRPLQRRASRVRGRSCRRPI